VIKFLLKTVAAGAVFYGTVHTLEKLQVAERVTNLADAALTRVAGLVPTGFAEDKTPDAPYATTDLRREYMP